MMTRKERKESASVRECDGEEGECDGVMERRGSDGEEGECDGEDGEMAWRESVME